MWISSFVVTLPACSERAAALTDALRAVSVFEVGIAIGRQLPVVLEAADGSAARYWHRWVEDLPGVISVNVTFVSFDESESPGTVIEAAADRKAECP